MSYLLCDMLITKTKKWESENTFLTHYIELSNKTKYGYFLMIGDNHSSLISNVEPVQSFKLYNTETKCTELADIHRIVTLCKKEEMIGTSHNFDGNLIIRCISVMGYLLSQLLDIKDVKIGYQGDILPIRQDFNVQYSIFIPNTNAELYFITLLRYSEADGYIQILNRDTFICDYIVYLFCKMQPEVRSYLSEFHGNVLRLWSVSDPYRFTVRQTSYMDLEISDVNEFKKLLAKSKVMG